MKKQYKIKGMSCGGCVNMVKNTLLGLDSIQKANIQLETPQAQISFSQEVAIETLQEAIGDFEISELAIVPPKKSSFFSKLLF